MDACTYLQMRVWGFLGAFGASGGLETLTPAAPNGGAGWGAFKRGGTPNSSGPSRESQSLPWIPIPRGDGKAFQNTSQNIPW